MDGYSPQNDRMRIARERGEALLARQEAELDEKRAAADERHRAAVAEAERERQQALLDTWKAEARGRYLATPLATEADFARAWPGLLEARRRKVAMGEESTPREREIRDEVAAQAAAGGGNPY